MKWGAISTVEFLQNFGRPRALRNPGSYRKPRKKFGLRLVGLSDKKKMNPHSTTTHKGSSMRRAPRPSGKKVAPLRGRAPRVPGTPPSRPRPPRDWAGDTLYLPPVPASSCRAAAPVTAAARSASQPSVPARQAAPTPTSNRSPQLLPFAPPLF